MEKQFKNHGTLNGLTKDQYEEFNRQQELHTQAREQNPEEHKSRSWNSARCWSNYQCSCGFGFDVDSSD
jgi:hypothetical protein